MPHSVQVDIALRLFSSFLFAARVTYIERGETQAAPYFGGPLKGRKRGKKLAVRTRFAEVPERKGEGEKVLKYALMALVCKSSNNCQVPPAGSFSTYLFFKTRV